MAITRRLAMSIRAATPLILVPGLLAGCGSGSGHPATAGGSSNQAAAQSTSTSATPATSGAATSGAPAPGALTADARSAATGDIPDNQVFLTFSAPGAGFSMKYPEGWTQSRVRRTVTFRSANNLVRVTIAPGPVPTPATVAADLRRLRGAGPALTFTTPAPIALPQSAAVRARYTTRSAPNPVTGRSVTLMVDRYALGARGRVAVVDLATPRGVDNVDAYRMMIESFRWR